MNNAGYVYSHKEMIIQEDGCIISEGTHNIDHLLSAVYSHLTVNNLNETLRDKIREVFEGDEPFNRAVYQNRCHIPEDKQMVADYLFNEDVYQYFNLIAPDGYYFGTLEGDGACFGWFKSPEETLEPGLYDGFIKEVELDISGEKVKVNISVNKNGNLVLDGIGCVTYEFYGEELVLMREESK